MTLHTKLHLLTDLNAIDPMPAFGKKIDKSAPKIDPEVSRRQRVADFESIVYDDLTKQARSQIPPSSVEKPTNASRVVLLGYHRSRVSDGHAQPFGLLTASQNYKAITTYGFKDRTTDMWFVKVKAATASQMARADAVLFFNTESKDLSVVRLSERGEVLKGQYALSTAVLANTYCEFLDEKYDKTLGKWMLNVRN